MNKKIKLTEEKLKEIVSNTVKEVLKESTDVNNTFNIAYKLADEDISNFHNYIISIIKKSQEISNNIISILEDSIQEVSNNAIYGCKNISLNIGDTGCTIECDASINDSGMIGDLNEISYNLEDHLKGAIDLGEYGLEEDEMPSFEASIQNNGNGIYIIINFALYPYNNGEYLSNKIDAYKYISTLYR